MKIICVGHNYQTHNEEMNRDTRDLSSNPVLFIKPETALLTSDKPQFYIPDFTNEVHYEAEIVVRIDKMGKNIDQRFAHRYYNELTIGIDLTARDLQDELKKKGLPWEISKAFDNSAVVGNYTSTLSLNINNINFSLYKNGELVQKDNTSSMLHAVDKIISYASTFFTLKTGDLIFTGTPAGVGLVAINDILTGYIEEEKMLELQIC